MSDNGKNGKPLPGKWQAYTLDAELDWVRAMFQRRYGCPPSEVVQSGPILLAGPIGESGAKRPQTAQVQAVTPTMRQTPGAAQEAMQGANYGPPSLLARVEAAQVDVTPERARQLALAFEGVN